MIKILAIVTAIAISMAFGFTFLNKTSGQASLKVAEFDGEKAADRIKKAHTKKGKLKMNNEAAATTSKLPPIDLAVPENLQTATFALG